MKARVLEKREERARKSGRVGKCKKSESEIEEREREWQNDRERLKDRQSKRKKDRWK